jgi:hypothetical protein
MHFKMHATSRGVTGKKQKYPYMKRQQKLSREEMKNVTGGIRQD